MLISWLSCHVRACFLLKYLGQNSAIHFFPLHPKNNTCDLVDNDNYYSRSNIFLPASATGGCYDVYTAVEQAWTVNLLLAVL